MTITENIMKFLMNIASKLDKKYYDEVKKLMILKKKEYNGEKATKQLFIDTDTTFPKKRKIAYDNITSVINQSLWRPIGPLIYFGRLLVTNKKIKNFQIYLVCIISLSYSNS